MRRVYKIDVYTYAIIGCSNMIKYIDHERIRSSESRYWYWYVYFGNIFVGMSIYIARGNMYALSIIQYWKMNLLCLIYSIAEGHVEDRETVKG